MVNIFESIITHFKENDIIHLARQGHFYTYIGVSTTKINGKEFKSITYRISPTNQKRVTKQLIEETYRYFRIHKKFPDISWYRIKFPDEIKSRPCNKSVAKGLMTTIIETK
ncbi:MULTISPECIES: hypothetical protein [unclassified Flavobacterium]|jgi:hypothetical protein|uniref:hypothetical protein n=1 Tax=unclassified Flavobacterium TaxID=196869 RepID=UPI0025C643AE|nr:MULTISPECIES: hypothetical protein [unclassified Flavobacterium]